MYVGTYGIFSPSMSPASLVGGYQLLDCGGLQRLERWAGVLTVRSCPSATWPPALPASAWADAELTFSASSDGGGWSGSRLAELEAASADGAWAMAADRGFELELRPGSHNQLGAFPEQAENWRFLHSKCSRPGKKVSMSRFRPPTCHSRLFPPQFTSLTSLISRFSRWPLRWPLR